MTKLKWKVYYRRPGFKPGEELAGDCYIIEADNEASAIRECRKLLKARFGCTHVGADDLNKQLVPKVAWATQIE